MLRSLAVVVAVVLGACSVFGQAGTEGSILGLVKDASGAVMPDATVTVKSLDTGLTKSAVTDANGYFQVLALPRGFYSVAAAKPGFKAWRLERSELIAGEQKRVEPVLAVGDVKQEITVSGSATLVQTESASVESAIEEKEIKELPLNGRDPIQMVSLVPGMRYLGPPSGNTLIHQVQGLGQHSDATQFSIDGMSANDPSSEGGMVFPNLDSVGQFRVETSSYSAENGRQPLQVQMITKSGTNEFHGTVWEFLRNDALDARNAFATTNPKLRRNQYGYTLGGPVVKNRTFFFASFEGLKIRSQAIFNTPTVPPAFLNGDFSSLKTSITDPETGRAFPGNQIPETRFDPAAKFFFPYLLAPNAPGNFFQALAPTPENGTNQMYRVDHMIAARQKIYFRYIRLADDQTNVGYSPSITSDQNLVQHNIGMNYDWTITPSLLFTLSGGFIHSDSEITSPVVGKENLTEKAGIQGFATAFREPAIGLPGVVISGYSGFSYPAQVPASFRREVLNGRSSMNWVKGRHTLLAGGEYLDNRTLAHHSSSDPRGTFTFNGQYTGNGFADYLLGLVQSARANTILADFAMGHQPYSALYVNDSWRVNPKLTIEMGVRWDRWYERTLVRGAGSTFDLATGKAVAGEDHGRVDLTAQPIAPYLAAATAGLWVPASQVGYPPGLSDSRNYVSPRIGAAWRPFGSETFVVRAGYGIFASSYNGNITGSQVIGPPYWASQQVTFAKASNQKWETAFPANPANFVAPSISAAVVDIKPMKVHDWNVAIEKAIPGIGAALTVAYVASRGHDLVAWPHINTARPGNYTNLQAALPYPQFGNINLYENLGREWYNSLQVKFNKRYSSGLEYRLSYAFARDISNVGNDVTAQPTLYAPANYDRGPSPLERRHILSVSGIYEFPLGRGKRFGGSMPRVLDFAAGGWQLSGIYSYQSGAPLTFTVPGATLGNGVNARPDIIGDPHLSNPSAAAWFNTAAFAAPPPYTFGNSGVGILQGPSFSDLDASLMKNFHVTESKYFQFRWELFNSLNHVNLGPVNTTLNQPTTGKILSAGDARQMQLALKFVF
jgi:hypothetical protein